MTNAETPDRYDVERMVEGSGLPTCSRDILFALARRMDQGTIFIPGRFNPSLARIAKVTGWSKRHVQRHLNKLEDKQLIMRSRSKGRRTLYAINWPALAELGTRSPENPEKTRDTESFPVGTPGPGTRDTGTPELGTRGRGTRDTMARSQTSQLSPDLEPDPEITMIRRLLEARTERRVTADWAAATRDTILAAAGAPAEPGPARSSFIRAVLVRDKHPERWLPTPTPPEYQREEIS
jgi:hypothetical protein